MAIVEFRYDPKNTAWFTANAAMVLKAGEPAYHDTTGLFKLGDGVTALSALSFLPIVSSSTPTIQQVLTAGQVATTTIETTGFIKTGGTSSQFLKADGSVDSSTYLTTLGTAATSLTTTGSSGAATLISNVLNVPNYTLAGLGGTTLAAVNAQNLSVFAATTSAQLAGVISDETGSGALVFGTSPTFTTSIITPNVTGVSGNLTLTNAIQSSGAITQFTFTNAANTNQTATSNIPNFRITGANKQWATGTVATQYFNYFSANTVSFVGASTATLAANFVADYVQGGTNATITTNTAIHVPTLALTNTTYGTGMYILAPTGATTNTAAKFLQNNGQVDIGSIAAGYSTIWMGQATPNASNYTLLMTGSSAVVLQASSTVGLSQNQGTHSLILGAGTLTLSDTTLNLVFGSTTGSKIGTATTQKLAFWNATPIVQPTTAVAAATFVANAGTAVNDASTFDGYTLAKVVKALRNIGLLA